MQLGSTLKFRRAVAAAVAVVALLGASLNVSRAQGPIPAQIYERPLQGLESTLHPWHGQPVEPPITEPIDYWIVSSRHCSQDDHAYARGCNLCYYHVGCDTHLRGSTADEFQAWLEPGVPIVFIAHGSFVSWEFVQKESVTLYRWLKAAAHGRRFQIVFYSWPSDHITWILPALDVGILGRRATRNTFYFTQLLRQIPGHKPITLMGHSHGARLAAATLHLMGGGAVYNKRWIPPVDNGQPVRAVFLAAAIDRHWLAPGERYDRALCRAESILNVHNTCDLALCVYPLRRPFSNIALGKSGLSKRDRRALGDAAGRVMDVNVRAEIGTGHLWDNYFEEPSIAETIVPYLAFADQTPVMGPMQSPSYEPMPSPTYRPMPSTMTSPMPEPAMLQPGYDEMPAAAYFDETPGTAYLPPALAR